MFGWVGAVGVEKGEQVTARFGEAGLERRAVALVDGVPNELDARNGQHAIGGAIA